MSNYLISFTVYTMAMVGVIFIGFLIAKKSLSSGCFSGGKGNFLTVESYLNLEPRKNLYVVKAGKERFLISTDTEGSRFLTKLETGNLPVIQEHNEVKPIQNKDFPALNFAGNVVQNNPIYETRKINKIINKFITAITKKI